TFELYSQAPSWSQQYLQAVGWLNTYDGLHRLTTAQPVAPTQTGQIIPASLAAYGLQLSYDATGNISTLVGPVSGLDLPSRPNLTYIYGTGSTADVNAVTTLRDSATSAVFAQYSYDLSGNMITRVAPGLNLQCYYDPNDQMRQAITGSTN